MPFKIFITFIKTFNKKSSMKKIFFITILCLTSLFTIGQSLIRDNTFGNSGIVNTNNYSSNGLGQGIYRIISVNDNKFVGIGSSRLIRYNENGTTDSSFGVNGLFVFPQVPGTYNYMSVFNVKLINGFFYLLGRVNYATANSDDGLIIRVSYDGLLDTTFGNNGFLSYNINENEAFHDVSITSDNKIIAVGIKQTYPWQKLFITKFNANGTIVNTFQNNGYKEIYVFPMATESIQNVSEIVGDRFIIACTGRMDINNSYSKLALLKLDTDGNFDLSFNSTGTYMMPSYNQFYYSAKFFGNFLYITNPQNYITSNDGYGFLFKINLLDLTSQIISVDRNTSDYFIHPDFSISTISNNIDFFSTPPNRNLFIKKYSPNGTLDNSFCNTGIYEFNLSDINNYQTDDLSSSIIIYDDKILVSGESQIPQSGINGFRCVFTRFSQIPLSTDTFSNDKKIVLSPNPALDYLKVSLNDINYPAKIVIYNLYGQEVFESNILNNENDLQINIDKLQGNIYLLKIIDNEGIEFTEKFIKK